MIELVCKKCNNSYSNNELIWKCKCDGLLDIQIDLKKVKLNLANRKDTILKYRELIPVNNDNNIISFNEYFTPVNSIQHNDRTINLKSDYLLTTGSYKDRGAMTLISKIRELGVTSIVEDSSGNAGSSIATYAGRSDINCEIYLSNNTPQGKIDQIRSTGSEVVIIDGDRNTLAKAVLQRANDLYYASHSWNPFFFHGTKTCAYEIAEQYRNRLPESIYIPVGNGTLIIGLYIGFSELLKLKLIDQIPKLIGVQSENCNTVYKKWTDNNPDLKNKFELTYTRTIADGIAVGDPVRISDIIEAVTKSDGQVITVSESEILDAYSILLSKGFFVEPTSAVSLAGVLKSSDHGNNLVILTGHGLKTGVKKLY